jgi:hypothetical protein
MLSSNDNLRSMIEANPDPGLDDLLELDGVLLS